VRGKRTDVAQAPARIVEELYAVPLSAFTRERDARAAALERAGEAAAAHAVRTLRKPTATLWATNQLGRAEPDRLERFLATVEQLRRSQLRDARAAAEAMRAQRAELDALVERAEDVLRSAGFRASPDSTREISSTLLGAAVDPERAADLRHGRLTAVLEAPGFEVLSGAATPRHLRLVAPQKPAPAPPARRPRDDAPRLAAERRRAAAEARAQARAARKAAAEAERLRRRREAEERARRTAERRAEVERLEVEARRLTSALADARRRLREEGRLAKRRPRGSPSA
jgi:hypothetical protein